MVVGDRVLYNDKVYTIVHIYESDYIEIKESDFKVELVHCSEIKPLKEK